MTAADIIREIKRHAINDTTRAIAAEGVHLAHEEADALDDADRDWLRNRLGCRVEEDDAGVRVHPAPRARGPRDHRLPVMLSAAEDGAIDAAGHQQRLTKAEWLRRAAAEKLERDGAADPEVVRSLRDEA